MKLLFSFLLIFFPMKVKRKLYFWFFGFDIHSTARIGFSVVMPKNLKMEEGSRIGHLNFVKNISHLNVGKASSIGNLNWITGFPVGSKSPHFADQPNRSPVLYMGEHSAITNRHLIDCTDSVRIGNHTTVAGFRSQILTHSISVSESRQRSATVDIGNYSFIGTGVILLPGSSIPDFSILGAGSVLNKRYIENYMLYAGNPARPTKKTDPDAKYFTREKGFIV